MENNAHESHVKDDEEETPRSEVEKLELENTRIREKFDVQRAKMKELFLQKEEELNKRLEENVCLREENVRLKDELNEAKSRLVATELGVRNDVLVEKRKAQEEIATLQQLARESSCSRNRLDAELRKLRATLQKLEAENVALRSQTPRDPPGDGPQISLSTVTKTLARKVASQLGADALSLGADGGLEGSMRKAQEGAEVIRSLVMPLEEEIHALKEKLRATDDKLQRCEAAAQQQQQQQQQPGPDPTETAGSCDMCANYEAQLVKMQTTTKELEKRLTDSDRTLQAQREDLSKEVDFRKEMEEKWNEKKEEHRIKVAELTAATQSSRQVLDELEQTFGQLRKGLTDDLSRLTREREQVQRHLDALQKENENLVGKHSKHSQQLQSETIDMPNSVEELHVSLLKMHEDLITAKVGQEVAREREETLRYEVGLLREQMEQDGRSRGQRESAFLNEIERLKAQLDKCERERRAFADREEVARALERQLEDATKERRDAELAVAELRQRVTNLQQELDTGEEVQKDFVRLSQSLQIQLERIREAGNEVRWQHDEDVEECPNCRSGFSVTKRKVHCRHCGQIFCHSCLTHIVNSGPKQRPSRVCDVCHTLLVPNTAPYFSHEPPHTPD